VKKALIVILTICAAAMAQDLPTIAVSVTGEDDGKRNKALGRLLLTSFVKSGRLRSVEQPAAFFDEAASSGAARDGAVDYERFGEMGRRYGARFVCLTSVTPKTGANRVSVQVIDLDLLTAVATVEAESPLTTFAEATETVQRIAALLFESAALTPEPPTVAAEPPPSTPEPVQATVVAESPPPSTPEPIPTPVAAEPPPSTPEPVQATVVAESPQTTIPEPIPTPVAAEPPPPEPAPTPAAPEPPNIAVYVTGNADEDERKALGTHILAALVNSGRYNGIERSSSFLAEIDKEHIKQRSGAIDDSQISELGRQFGVKYICIADITPVYGDFQVSARIVNVETAEVAYIGEAMSHLKTVNDLTMVSSRVVARMFGLPEPPDEQKSASQWLGIEISAGGGGFFAGNYGGGLEWANGERITMPYSRGGMYLYMDVHYAEAFIGYSAGSGKWESADVRKNGLPKMQSSCLNFGIFMKYPFNIMGRAKVFPLAGVDYEMSTSVSIKPDDENTYPFDGANNRPDANALSALWVRFGGGVDYGLGHTIYLRAELLYGLRTACRFEKDDANAEKAKWGEDVKIISGNGVTFKAGVGVNF